LERRTETQKYILFLLFFATFFTFSCSLNPKRVIWPENSSHFKAYCEIETYFKDLSFSGFLSLELDYPDFYAEVFGPFGTTLMTVEKRGSSLRVDYGGTEDNGELETMFLLPIEEIIYDIFATPIYLKEKKTERITKEKYEVTYYSGEKGPKICWNRADGGMCLSFLQIK